MRTIFVGAGLVMIISLTACQQSKFRGSNSSVVTGNEVPENEIVNVADNPKLNPEIFKQDPKDPNDPEKRFVERVPVAPDQSKLPVPGPGIDPNTGVIPKEGPVLTTVDFNIPCTHKGERIDFTHSSARTEKVVATVTGDICPRQGTVLTLFLVDVSGSMSAHRDPEGFSPPGGSDPSVILGNCARRQGAQTVINSFASDQGHRFGFIPFAGDVLTEWVVEGEEKDRFREQTIESSRFCSYVPQNANMGFVEKRATNAVPASIEASLRRRLGDSAPGTNYQAALQKAEQIILKNKTAYDRFEIFFITDGYPTLPGNSAQAIEAAKQAGLKLYNNREISQLTINAIYMAPRNNGGFKKVQDTLTAITGSAQRVFNATDTAQIESVIKNIQGPVIPAEFSSQQRADAMQKMATLSVSNYLGFDKDYFIPLGMRSLVERNNSGIWNFGTQKFYLARYEDNNNPVDHVVDITINGDDGGFRYFKKAVIRYTPQP